MFTSFVANDDFKPVNNLKKIDFNAAETPFPLFSNESEVTDSDETMKIYLRFRPLPMSQHGSPYFICDHSAITANPPEQSVSYKNLLHGYGKGYQKFSFSKVFIPDSNQDFIYSETAKILLDDFARCNDRLLFTYGTTSSGKTFTMNGNKTNVGIIPRSLFDLFKSTKLSNNPNLMPIDFAEVLEIKQPDIQKLLKEKSILLKISEKESSDILQIFNNNDCFPEKNIQTNNANPNYETTFWISYTEIYNELIYDLLDPVAIANLSSNNKLKRPILDIRTARNGGSYVKGLKSYPVFSAEEAYRLLLVGRRSQTIGATRLNQNSSRSHTIFTIRAVRSTPGSEYLSRVCNFSFCDLAGSERTDKAQTSGMMQKEASNINSSLLALGRCIDVLKHNQSNPNGLRVVPYRDSKLTRLFQTYLGGNGKAAMIVCINQDPQLFDESLQVLKFSALAKKIVLREKEKSVKTAVGTYASGQRLSLYRRLGMNTPKPKQRDTIESLLNDEDYIDNDDDFDLDETVENVSEEEFVEEYDVEELLDIIGRLKTELIAVRKAKVADEAKIREKLNREYVETIMTMERDHLRNVQALRDNMQEQMKKRARAERNKAYRQLKKRKIQPEYEEIYDNKESSSEENVNLVSLENEITDLKSQLKDSQEEATEAKETIEILIQEKQQLEVHSRTLEFQLQIASKPKSCQSKTVSVQTDPMESSIDEYSIIDIDCSANSQLDQLQEPLSLVYSNRNQTFKPKLHRFSAFSSNPSVSEDDDSMDSSQKIHHRFFEPLVTPGKGNQGNPSTPCTVKKNFKVELIKEEENNESSFLKHEEECTIDDLQQQLSNLEIEVDNKSSEIRELRNQLEIMENKLASREKSIEKYIDKEKDAGKRLNSLLAQLHMPIDNEVCKMKRKLKMLSKAIQQIQSGFREINQAIPLDLSSKRVLTDSTNIENQENLRIDVKLVIADIKQLDHQMQSARADYHQLISICNERIIDQASCFLGIHPEKLTIDTSLDDISQLFHTIWNCAIEKLESITSSMGDSNQQINESENAQEQGMSFGISEESQMRDGEETVAQSQVDKTNSNSSGNY